MNGYEKHSPEYGGGKLSAWGVVFCIAVLVGLPALAFIASKVLP